MLKALSVRNYVLIDSLEIDFPEGLIIITGQTGAGKSIILGALSLLMGAKADAEAIAEGAETCSVEAEFETGGDAELLALLKENDLGEGGSLILRRVVNRSGRSRCCTLGVLHLHCNDLTITLNHTKDGSLRLG